MRAKFVAGFVVFLVVIKIANADEWQLDWLPPAPPPQTFWSLAGNQESGGANAAFVEVLRSPTQDGSAGSASPLAGRFNLASEWSIEQARWRSKLEAPDYRDLREVPASPRDWKAEHALDMPLPVDRSLFMFGQVNANGDVDQTTSKVKGRTGFGWKCTPFFGSELQVRTGSLVTYEDVPQSRPTERSQLSVELQAKIALIGPLQLQYAAEALPALAQTDRNTLLHDVKIALPMGTNRELSIGAKYHWDDALAPTPWTQRAELYLGFKFER
jgi:hypothetical protein